MRYRVEEWAKKKFFHAHGAEVTNHCRSWVVNSLTAVVCEEDVVGHF
jgi:hypothetical protein